MIDQAMNAQQIKVRRLEIAVRMGELAEADCEIRKQLLGVESEAAGLNRELAELELLEADIPVRPQVRPHGNRHDG